jgi:hypothetical protein
VSTTRVSASAVVFTVLLHPGLALADPIPAHASAASRDPATASYYAESESGPITLPYREDAPFPPGYRLEQRTRTGLVVAGAIVLGVPYVIGLGATSTNGGDPAMNWLFVPGVGPWMALGLRRSSCYGKANIEGSLCHAGDAFAVMGLIMDGIVQTAGATLLIVGLAVPKKVYVRKDVQLGLIPAPAGTGLGVQGTF